MPQSEKAQSIKQQKGFFETKKMKRLFDEINIGEKLMLSFYINVKDEPKVGAPKKKRIITTCQVTQKNDYCLFVRLYDRIKCLTEADIITKECQIWRDSDEIVNN